MTELSRDQEEALEAILPKVGVERELSLVGPAGSGKTTLTRTIIETTERPVVLGAPTGKASLVLAKATGRRASTLHRLLYGTVSEDEDRNPVFGRPSAPCAPGDLLIIDESSMVGEKLYDEFMSWVPEGATVLFVGDREQLPPVRGTWGPELVNPTAALTEVHRQAQGNPIISYATAIREGRAGDFEGDPDDPRLQMEESFHAAVQWLVGERKAGNDATLITFTHKVRKALNKAVRDELGLSEAKHPIVSGDSLVVRYNNYKLGLMNGEVVTVEDVLDTTGGVLEVVLKECPVPVLISVDHIGGDGRDFRDLQKRFRRYNLLHVHYGQCLTVHSSQGSQWDNVGFAWDNAYERMESRNPEEGRRFLYTAVTRAAENLKIFVV
jgi:exodeoxyribonuclease V